MLSEFFDEFIEMVGDDVFMIFLVCIVGLWAEYEETQALQDSRSGDGRAELISTIKRAMEMEEKEREEPRPKRVMVAYDRKRAQQCIADDYWGPSPRFNDKQFERVFRVTRSIANQIMLVAGNSDSFFRVSYDAAGRRGVCPTAKLLIALEMMACGVSGSAFVDYFQMGLSTAQQCLLKLIAVISDQEGDLAEIYLRKMTRADAKKANELHEEHHHVSGMVGSLDCMHILWRCCPKAWAGQFSGKEGAPTIVLEAACDYNLWIWHAAFGFPGSMNDINIWDQSSLLKSFLDGSFSSEVDFQYEIGGCVFNKLYFLTDGIYPLLSRFVKTIDEAVGPRLQRYAVWQESARKDIERCFGVLQRKFHILVKPVEMWKTHDIANMTHACIVLHNMMIEHRIANNEQEQSNWYEYETFDDDDNNSGAESEGEIVRTQQAEREQQQRFEDAFYDGDAVNLLAVSEARQAEEVHRTFRQLVAKERWNALTNKDAHFSLREAIIKQLNTNSAAYHG